jgi:chromosome segregation ATPase
MFSVLQEETQTLRDENTKLADMLNDRRIAYVTLTESSELLKKNIGQLEKDNTWLRETANEYADKTIKTMQEYGELQQERTKTLMKYSEPYIELQQKHLELLQEHVELREKYGETRQKYGETLQEYCETLQEAREAQEEHKKDLVEYNELLKKHNELECRIDKHLDTIEPLVADIKTDLGMPETFSDASNEIKELSAATNELRNIPDQDHH